MVTLEQSWWGKTVNRVSGDKAIFLLGAYCLGLLGYLFYDGLAEMEWRWANKEEYSHGYMIPLVALFLFYQKLPSLLSVNWISTWWSVFFMVVALSGWLLGELSSLFIIVHYAFLLALGALGLGILGWRGVSRVWPAFLYLVFMIPLPTFIYNGISQYLQLISTQIGVLFVHLFDISVYVSGNVIDLGVYQLQVAEACSGLRYLFPLMSFGFLIAMVYRGPAWHKWIIFLSTIPITVLMNSFRIGVIGLTVEYWGIAAAEGFLHEFEGWFVFLACLGVLFLVMMLLSYLSFKNCLVLDRLNLDLPSLSEIRNAAQGQRNTLNVLLVLALLLTIAIPYSVAISNREEIISERTSFASFPLLVGDWMGSDSSIEPKVLKALNYPDYLKADYRRGSDEMPVNLYVAYYQSQRKGSSIHSPRSCIPGGGWEIKDLTQQSANRISGAEPFNFNRLIIEKGNQQQLVYYWFAQRGRIITNEYLAKWYLFQDGVTMQRSDGALVRLVTPVMENTHISDADGRLMEFLNDFYPLFPAYLPGGAE